jgi:hypothetical protein
MQAGVEWSDELEKSENPAQRAEGVFKLTAFGASGREPLSAPF